MGHSFKEGYTLTEASCTEEGLSFEFCSKCGTVKAVTTPREPHSYVDGICTVCQRSVYSEGLEYVLNEDGASYSVKGMGTCTDTELGIPGTYEGLPVTGILPKAFYLQSNLKSVIILDGVKTIGNEAFSTCSKITEIIIPNSVTSIGNRAFWRTGIKSVTVPGSVENIGDMAFGANHYLTDLTLLDGLTSIGEKMFYSCRKLTSVTIPASVTVIDDFAFYYCAALESITFSSGVSSIGKSAFSGCRVLSAVNYLGTVADWCKINFEYSGSNPFYNNSALLYIEIGRAHV